MRKLAIGAVLLAGLWSVAWFVAQHFVEARLDDMILRQAERGTRIECKGRVIGGFPAGMSVSCESLRIVSPDARRPAELRTGPLRVNYSLLDPLAVGISQLTDFKFEMPNGDVLQGRFSELTGLLGMSTAGPRRIELHARKAELTGSRFEGRIEAAELRGTVTFRPDPSGTGLAALVEVALVGLSRPGVKLLGQELVGAQFDLKSNIVRVDLFRRGSLPSALEAWRRAEGQAEILSASASLGELNLTAFGKLAIDGEHRPEGTVSGRVRGGETAARFVRERFTGLAARLAGATGRLDLPYRLTLRDGKIKFGPLSLGDLRPLY